MALMLTNMQSPPDSSQISRLAVDIDGAVIASSLSRATLYRAIAEGRLVARKFHGRTLILTSDIEAFLNSLPTARAPPG